MRMAAVYWSIDVFDHLLYEMDVCIISTTIVLDTKGTIQHVLIVP